MQDILGILNGRESWVKDMAGWLYPGMVSGRPSFFVLDDSECPNPSGGAQTAAKPCRMTF
jgi:hypothetical protein